MPDALQLLREDHQEVQDLFKQFEQTEDRQQKQMIADKALTMLEIHAEMEEELFYPALRRQEDAEEEKLDEAAEEHHVAEMLISELRRMRSRDQRFDAKFKVLA